MHRAAADPLFRVEYAREPDISPALDRELIELISTCFHQPHNAFFKERRYAQEMPLHRYMMRSAEGRLVAHLAVHDKVLSVAGAELRVGGMAEVCVHESARGRGYVRLLLEEAHRELVASGVEFAFLFGDANVYGSSGYRHVSASIARLNHATQIVEATPLQSALVKPLANRAWPEGPVDLRGPLF